ncbi:YcdB/YcdC domain-containing protein [Anaeromicrobium sediminis]|uniref:YcdB/YcdC domain-containing protein n=1 Tax=Anaeromicrobium sediminis TaxID=1478221 RepID=UPI001595D08D|nr:YcdB/YcdC domain-containing protein [Anaeromicrobium sediminis]
MQRKIMSLFLVLVMVFSISMPAFANEDTSETNVKISKDKATDIGKEFLKNYFATEIDEKKFETRIELEKSWRQKDSKVWRIRWRNRKENGGVNFRVEIDANTGILLDCTKDSYDYDEKISVPSISEEEAKKKAQEFLKKIQPGKVGSVKLRNEENRIMNRYDISNYRFEYVRQINGVEFPSNGINLGIDGTNGELIEYRINWDYNIDAPKVENIIDKEEARKLLEDEVAMEKYYLGIRDEETRKTKNIKLVYRASYKGKNELDAKTKEFKEYNIDKNLESKDISFDRKQEIYKKALNIKKEKVDKERAEEIIKTLLKDLYEKEIEIDSIEYMENVNRYRNAGKNCWEVEFRKKGAEKYDTDGGITINADTGEILSVNIYNYRRGSEEFELKLTWNEAYDKAIEAIERFYPDKIRDIDTNQNHYKRLDDDEIERDYYFHFSRKENGIGFDGDSININISAQDGTIEDIHMRWTDNMEFPNHVGKISEEKGKELWLKNLECKLIYSKDMDKKHNKLNLVYVLENKINRYGLNIDANTGTFVDYSGKEVKLDEKPNVDKNHPYIQELKVLAAKEVIDIDKVSLNNEITLIDAVKMLTKAKGYRAYRANRYEDLKFTNISKEDENYSILKGAVYFKILDNEAVEFNKEKKVNNMDMAKLMVKALGYEKLAKAQDIYVLPFKDANKISEEDKGYVALCKGLGLIEGEEFNPQKNITYLDMAIIIYKSLENFKEY